MPGRSSFIVHHIAADRQPGGYVTVAEGATLNKRSFVV